MSLPAPVLGVPSSGVFAPNPPNMILGSSAIANINVSQLNPGDFYTDQVNGLLYNAINKFGSGISKVLIAGTSGSVIQLTADSGTATPTAGNINILGGTGCNTSASGSTVTINVTGQGSEFTVVTADTAMNVNQGYITNKAGTAASMTLPSTAVVGSQITVLGLGATGWVIAQNAGQTVHMNATNSTTGAGGSTTNTSRYQSITLICVIANTDWEIVYTSDAVTIV
jgi:hypothetical protein